MRGEAYKSLRSKARVCSLPMQKKTEMDPNASHEGASSQGAFMKRLRTAKSAWFQVALLGVEDVRCDLTCRAVSSILQAAPSRSRSQLEPRVLQVRPRWSRNGRRQRALLVWDCLGSMPSFVHDAQRSVRPATSCSLPLGYWGLCRAPRQDCTTRPWQLRFPCCSYLSEGDSLPHCMSSGNCTKKRPDISHWR